VRLEDGASNPTLASVAPPQRSLHDKGERAATALPHFRAVERVEGFWAGRVAPHFPDSAGIALFGVSWPMRRGGLIGWHQPARERDNSGRSLPCPDGESAAVLATVKRWVLAVLAMLPRRKKARCAWLRAAALPPPKRAALLTSAVRGSVVEVSGRGTSSLSTTRLRRGSNKEHDLGVGAWWPSCLGPSVHPITHRDVTVPGPPRLTIGV
jgi:hypothetical protein